MTNYHPADRPDPSEQPIRARVPEHVSGGAFSTGVIVMTAQTEFILDFVQNLGRPHQIVARIVMPHNVLPQLVDALHRNMDLYRGRWGELPLTPGLPSASTSPKAGASAAGQAAHQPSNLGENQEQSAAQPDLTMKAGAGSGGASGGGNPIQPNDAPKADPTPSQVSPAETGNAPNTPNSGARQASAQEIYDDLKIRDELLSGAYANAVMIGHGPHEFSFDFITNFYPHSAVSARVFLAAGQIPRLYDSLKGTWEQLRQRMQPPGGFPPPFPPSGDPPPFA